MSRLRIIPFGRDIIDEVALVAGSDPSLYKDTCIVFPGKRPFFYLKKKLAALHGTRAFVPPQCMSLDQFIDAIIETKEPGIKNIDRMDAVWILFDLISALPEFDRHPFRKEGFGEFFRWGSYLLNFIDRLDMEGIEMSALVNVEKNAAIGYDVPESINQLLANISVLRNEFHSRLKMNEWYTRGLKHITAIDELNGGTPRLYEHVIFAGLFGLTGSEKKIVKSFWDGGETTVVLYGNPDDWPILKDFITYLKAVPEFDGTNFPRPVIHLHAGQDAHAEVLETYRILADNGPKKTAIVLPTPDPLFPLLNFVIDRIEVPCNISLGYPIERTSIFDLIRQVIRARIEMRSDGRYPASGYLRIMAHPFIKNLFPDTEFRLLILNIEKFLSGDTEEGVNAGKAIVSLEEIEAAMRGLEGIARTSGFEKLPDIHTLLFRSFNTVSTIAELTGRLTEILDIILKNTPVRSYVLSGPVFESMFNALETLKRSFYAETPLSHDPSRNIRALCDLALYQLSSSALPFDTHPVEEIEVLGMLEARNISFERVIILDVNEGVLPGPREINPVIPLGIFEMLGIPSPEFTESLYRYNFYRLTGSAQEVHLIYRTSDETPRSRYIEEIVWDEEKRQRKLNIIPVDRMVFPVNLKRDAALPEIEKTSAVINALLHRGISPSALDMYVRCPLRYYFLRLIHFEDDRAFSDDIDAAERGDLIHSVLYDTFQPFIRMPLTKDNRQDIGESLKRAILRHLTQTKGSGELYLLGRIASYKLGSFVDKFFRNITDPISIEYLEDKFSTTMDVGNIPVTLAGEIDRIDKNISTGIYRIVDYKTGTKLARYPASAVNKTDFSDILSLHENVPSFQLPVYILMFCAAKGLSIDAIDASLIFLGNNDEEEFFKKQGDGEKDLLMNAYVQGVRTVISDMLDIRKPFSAFDTRNCADCPARDLCHV
ncbi:MAG: PD-(D/E)XK nuclease family protein [Syntrophorhabdaceae bacterium]